ncbi:hypothetical protein L1049_028207 [Liquidambar formosana]|uniref:H15 domain-containing protein n=1 Tax=Liquidambar formosana TaxID=63359 RepID=A0AAP0WT33_LIQFO
MDPLVHLPDIAEAHIAHAANPTPSHGPNHNHPPYAEMITAAITALKERNGSSRRAIAKYIEGAYTNLPPTHSALLTHHLKRLKNNGHLVMVKHSYKLPRSESSSGTGTLSLPKRGPGRPPKPQPQPQPSTEPMFVALGLVDGPTTVTKRRPGRPPKVKTISVGVDGLVLTKKSPGRPRKPKLVSGVLDPGGIKKSRGRPPKPKLMSDLLGPSGMKRGPGRPRKTQTVPMVVPYLSNLPRPRGRPKKDGASRAKAPGRPRGRPRMNLNAIADGGAGGMVSGMRRGRLPKVGGVKKPRKGTGKPVGRPRKSNALTKVEPAEPAQWMIEYGDIKNKLEYVQSRIKQAVGVLKPHLTNENAVSAVAALQELEDISTMDIATAPLQHVPVQEPVIQNPVIQNQEPH